MPSGEGGNHPISTSCAAKARVISIRAASDISDGKASSHSRAVTELLRVSRASAAFHKAARSCAQSGAPSGARMKQASTPRLAV